jgi:hypothetical protein
VEATVITLLIAFPLAGAVIRRWTTLALPLIGWALFYLGLDQSWWGNGLGDGWPYVAAALLLVGVVTTALVVAFARRAKPRRHAHFA